MRKAFSLDLNLPINTFREPDIPELNAEVRALGRDWYGLRVRDSDPDDRVVIGVVIEPGRERGHAYRLPGWIKARDAKRPEWRIAPRGRPPMFAVPQSALAPLSALRKAHFG